MQAVIKAPFFGKLRENLLILVTSHCTLQSDINKKGHVPETKPSTSYILFVCLFTSYIYAPPLSPRSKMWCSPAPYLIPTTTL